MKLLSEWDIWSQILTLMAKINIMLAKVIPESKSYKLDTFSYLIPDNLIRFINIGAIVNIPFGKHFVRGLVVDILKESIEDKESSFFLKKIISIDSDYCIPKKFFKVIAWISENYFCTYGEALSLFLPPKLKRPIKHSESEKQNIPHNKIKLNKLSTIQYEVYKCLLDLYKNNLYKPTLLHGVTGSGKTEIYLHLCYHVLSLNKSAIILVPEILLTPQIIQRFQAIFGDEVAVIHSKISNGDKRQAYYDFFHNQKRILIGPRSALLVPNADIGLIIIDEEHEDAYKQDKSPRYHAVDLAEKIAKELKIPLILGSATPRIETYYKAEKGLYNLYEIKTRYNKLMLPPSEIIDLKNEIRSGNNSLISNKLFKSIQQTLSKKKQIILFLNRRGSSTFISCRECGHVINCPNCDIPLVHHQNFSKSYLYCHHCDFNAIVPSSCPHCGSSKIKYFGAGVEKVEYEINKLFPKARIKRVDADTISNRSDYLNFYNEFKNHKYDIIIGTQMITKGFDIPNVDLVGIISADSGLHLPYFRASEKIFRLVTQVSGRSGRSQNTGMTIIQSYWPNSKAILYSSQHDFKNFYQSEIENRLKHNYPPFRRLIRVVSENENLSKSKKDIDKLADELNAKNMTFIGPGKCFFQKVRNKWRFHIIIKLENQVNEEQKYTLRELWKNNLNLIWDADPQDML